MQNKSETKIISKLGRKLRVGLVGLALTGILAIAEKSHAQPSNPGDLENLVFVTEDLASNIDGCDAITVFDDRKADPIHRGITHISPGRLAANSDFTTILAPNSNGISPEFIYTLTRNLINPETWVEGDLEKTRISDGSGIAVLGDDDSFLVTIGNANNIGQGTVRLTKFKLSEAGPGKNRNLGPEHGSIRMDTVPAEIITLKDGFSVYAITGKAEILKIDTRTMIESSPRIKLPPFYVGQNPVGTISHFNVHAVMTSDESYMIVNRWDIGSVSLADLKNKTSQGIPLQNVDHTISLALNGGWINSGLLAVHTGTSVSVYEFHPDLPPPNTVKELSRISINRPSGFINSTAWSGSGAHIIASTNLGPSEFRLISVNDSGRTLTNSFAWRACSRQPNYPNDILTANGRITPPITPTIASVSTPVETPTPTRTSSSTPTIELSSTPTVTITPTKIPEPIYLPIAITEKCDPQDQHADTALVIDASTSMLDTTRTGSRKIDAAIDAARQFISLQQMPPDQNAVVSFNRDAYLQQELTGDRNLLNNSLDKITVQTQTRIDLGVKLAHEELMSSRHNPDNNSVMVVLTDGYPTVPDNLALNEASRAKTDGIRIFTIGLGQAVATDMLRQMASRPEDYIEAPDGKELSSIYRQIAFLIPCPPDSFWPRTILLQH